MDDDRPGLEAGFRYREFAPAADVRGIVACTWTSGVGSGGRIEPTPIIPDGCVDLIFFGDEPPHVAGPATRTHWAPPIPPGTVITGLRLRPGAARAVLRLTVAELRDRDVPLRDVCGGRATTPLDDLLAIENPAARRAALERWVRVRLDQHDPADRSLVAAAARLSRPPWPSIDGLATQMGWTPRRLHRAFVAACGYGPKRLQRTMRLQRAIGLARTANEHPLPLPQLAIAAGYADQAHMTREFAALTGFTPAVYLATASAGVGRWLDESFAAPR